ncbi:MAG: 6-bladed beta-propeller [Candidatus Aminicenantes bacterium]|jgi:hypothetical protein
MKYIVLILITLVLIWPCGAKEYFVLGEKVGDGEILYPTQVEEGPDGNIYVYDRMSVFIKVFSSQGNYLRKMGGKGQGPGEIQRADGLSFNFTYDDNMLYFTEFFGGHRWITFMNLSGKFHHVIKLKMDKIYGILSSMPLQDGSFLTEVSFLSPPEAKKDYYLWRYPIALVKINPQGEIVSEILRTSHVRRISLISGGGDLPIPHTPAFIWVLLKNNSIIFTEGLTQEFKIYNMKGKITGEIKTPLPAPQPVTAGDLDTWRQDLKSRIRDKSWFNEFGKVIYKYKESIHRKKPNLDSVSLTPNNNLLIIGERNPGKQARPYWLIDLEGKIIKTVEIADPINYLAISTHFIFAWSTDEDDNPLVLCIKRKGTEAEDLAREASAKTFI